jgi:dolichyl-phosphate-mannose--protein O-mannosyl transferase
MTDCVTILVIWYLYDIILVFFTVIRYIFRCLVYVIAILYITYICSRLGHFSNFGTLYQGKSGNPGLPTLQVISFERVKLTNNEGDKTGQVFKL